MIGLAVIFYTLVGAGVALQLHEHGERVGLSVYAGMFWPVMLGLAIGEISASAVRENYRRVGKPSPFDSREATGTETAPGIPE